MSSKECIRMHCLGSSCVQSCLDLGLFRWRPFTPICAFPVMDSEFLLVQFPYKANYGLFVNCCQLFNFQFIHTEINLLHWVLPVMPGNIPSNLNLKKKTFVFIAEETLHACRIEMISKLWFIYHKLSN